MTEVINIKPMAMRGSFEPVPELVEEIEKLLTLAKTGKLRAIACALVKHDDHFPDGTINSMWVRGPYTNFALAAAISRLAHKWSEDQWS